MRQLITNVGADYIAFFVTGIVVLIVTLIYLWWNDRNEGKLSVPGLAPTDITLGNLKEITKDGGLHQFLSENHKKYGPMFSFFWGKELTVSLGSPEVWKDCQTLFDRPVAQFALFKPMVGDHSIQYMNTPIGQKHRKLLDRHYSFSMIGLYFHKLVDIGNELVNKWKQLPKEEMIPLRQHMLAIAIKSIIKTSFGDDYFKTNKEILELTKNYDICWGEMESGLEGDFAEAGSDRQKNYDKALGFLEAKVKEIVNHRKLKQDKDDPSLIDLMLENKDLYSSDQQIFDMVITYIVGGFHTTGNLLTWAVFYLCKNPEVVEKMLKEIEEVLGDKQIEKEDFDKLVYTKQVIDETMRCSVLAPFAGRFSEYDLIIGGHLIPKQTPMMIALGSVLQDEKVFPEPKRFNPDRFGADAPRRHPLAFQPFGFAGKRKCPGYRFAYWESVIFLVAIVRNFKFTSVSDDVLPVHGLVTSPKEEIYINIEKR